MAIDKAITYLKKNAPKGEFLAYINPKEAAMLKKAGGSGKKVNGIPSFRPQDMGNKDNQKRSAASTGSTSRRSSTRNTTSAGTQDTGNPREDYISNYVSKGIVKGGGTEKAGGGYHDATVSGDRGRTAQQEFVDSVNKNNRRRAEASGTRFTPYQGGARNTSYYKPNPLSGLLKLAVNFAFPGSGFLLNQGSKLKDGLMGLNDSIQNSDFGRSTSLMDYLDMKKFGGFDERELARQKTMQSSRDLQADIDAGMYDGPSRVNPTFQNDLGNELMLSIQKTPERFLPNAGPKQDNIPAGDAVSYVPFSNYGKANAATLDGVPLNEALAPTPVEQLKDKAYTGIKENVGSPFSNFLNNLYNADQIAALENEYGSKYGITNTSGGISSDARHMAAMNELSKSLSPMNNRVGEFIGDTGAFLAGAVNEIPALFRGLDSKNLKEIKEDIIANYKGSFGTPNQTTAEQIYGDVFEGSTPARTASVPTYGTAAAAEIRPTMGVKDTGLGFSVPTGDVGLNASGKLGNLSATVDAIDALKGESIDPQLTYTGDFGNTTAYGNFSDDVQNIGLNFSNDKGLSGGISYDAITGEPRFDIGFKRTFADGGIASMFTRRG